MVWRQRRSPAGIHSPKRREKRVYVAAPDTVRRSLERRRHRRPPRKSCLLRAWMGHRRIGASIGGHKIALRRFWAPYWELQTDYTQFGGARHKKHNIQFYARARLDTHRFALSVAGRLALPALRPRAIRRVWNIPSKTRGRRKKLYASPVRSRWKILWISRRR